jgi:hypothetical protein
MYCVLCTLDNGGVGPAATHVCRLAIIADHVLGAMVLKLPGDGGGGEECGLRRKSDVTRCGIEKTAGPTRLQLANSSQWLRRAASQPGRLTFHLSTVFKTLPA